MGFSGARAVLRAGSVSDKKKRRKEEKITLSKSLKRQIKVRRQPKRFGYNKCNTPAIDVVGFAKARRSRRENMRKCIIQTKPKARLGFVLQIRAPERAATPGGRSGIIYFIKETPRGKNSC